MRRHVRCSSVIIATVSPGCGLTLPVDASFRADNPFHRLVLPPACFCAIAAPDVPLCRLRRRERGWGCYFLLYNFVLDKELLDLGFIAVSPHVAAMLIVFPLTFFTGFWLNRHVAFRRSPLATGTQLFRYLLSVAGSVVVNYLFLKFFVELCGFWATPSQMMASLGTMVYSYLAAKYFTFRNAVRE